MKLPSQAAPESTPAATTKPHRRANLSVDISGGQGGKDQTVPPPKTASQNTDPGIAVLQN